MDDLKEMTVEQLGEIARLPLQLRTELCRAIQQSLESVLESVGDNCPECDSSLDRPKCLWDLGGSCPRHEVKHIKRDHPKRIAELGDEIAALTTATAAADELLRRLSEVEQWKREAILVLADWDKVYELVKTDRDVGLLKSTVVVERLSEMKMENAGLRSELDELHGGLDIAAGFNPAEFDANANGGLTP